MIEPNIKKIAVLFIDRKTNTNWTIFYDVGVNKYLVRIGDYIRAATCHPTFLYMQNVGVMEIADSSYDDIRHGTVINRWI